MPETPADRYLTAAERSLPAADAELRQHFVWELRERIDSSPSTEQSSAAMERAAADLEDSSARKKKRVRRLAISILLLLTTLAGLADPAWQAWRDRDGIRMATQLAGGSLAMSRPEKPACLERLDSRGRLLFEGDGTGEGNPDLFKSLWQASPDRAAYYEFDAVHRLKKGAGLPPDFVETFARLDPGNGQPHLLTAGVKSRAAISTGSRKSATIVSRADFDEALKLVQQALAQPVLVSRVPELLAERKAVLGSPRDLPGELAIAQAGIGVGSSSTELLALVSLFDAGARESVARDDRKLYFRLDSAWKGILSRLLQSEPGRLMDALILKGAVSGPSKEMATAASHFEQAGDVAYYNAIEAGMKGMRTTQDAPRQDPVEFSQRRPIGQFSIYPGFWQVPVADLAPGRLAEHALLQRLLILCGAGVAGIAWFLVAGFRFRGGVLTRLIASHASDLVGRNSRSLACVSAVAPFAAVLLYSWLAPSGSTAWSLRHAGAILTLAQFPSALLLGLLLPVIVVRRGLRSHAGFLHLAGKSRVLTAICLCLALAVILVAALPLLPGFDALFDDSTLAWQDFWDFRIRGRAAVFLWIAAALAAPALLTLGILVVRALFSSRRRLPGRLAVAAGLLRPYACLTALAAICLPLLHQRERHWHGSDRLYQSGGLETQICHNILLELRGIVSAAGQAAVEAEAGQ